MNQNEFVEAAFKKLPKIKKADIPSIERDLIECFKDGFTLQDAVKSNFYREEVSPHFSEEYACKQIGLILSKYRTGKSKKFPV